MEGIFYDGQIFDAYVQIVNLIKQAKRSVILIDNYIDETTLTMLSKRSSGVTATIYTRQLSQQQQLDVQRHNQQYPPIIINVCQRNHDRFLIIDDVVYVFGASQSGYRNYNTFALAFKQRMGKSVTEWKQDNR